MRPKTQYLSSRIDLSDSQTCVKAFRKASLPREFREEIESFIKRNLLEDCGRVAPNCLKAHMVRTAKEMNMDKTKIQKIKNLFKSRIGYRGYYLDNGKLKRIQYL